MVSLRAPLRWMVVRPHNLQNQGHKGHVLFFSAVLDRYATIHFPFLTSLSRRCCSRVFTPVAKLGGRLFVIFSVPQLFLWIFLGLSTVVLANVLST